MENNQLNQAQLDNLLKENSFNYEGLEETDYGIEVHFFRAQKIWDFKNNKREVSLISGSNIQNLFLINDKEDNYKVIKGLVGKKEQKLSQRELTTDTLNYINTFQRQITFNGNNMSFLEEGLWFASFGKSFEELTKEDLKNMWIIAGQEKEVGLFGDDEVDEDNPILEELTNCYFIRMNDFTTANNNLILIRKGEPIILDDQWQLNSFDLIGNFASVLFNNVQLKGYDNSNGKERAYDLFTNKFPNIGNPISVDSVSKFFAPWLSDKILPFGIIKDLYEGKTTLEDLLYLDSEDITTNYEGMGVILNASLILKPLVKEKDATKDYKETKVGYSSFDGVWPKKWAEYTNNGKSKRLSISMVIENEPTNNGPHLVQTYSHIPPWPSKNTMAARWNGFAEDVRTGLSNADSIEKVFAYSLEGVNGDIVYLDKDGNQKIAQNSKLEICPLLMATTSEIEEKGWRTIKEVNLKDTRSSWGTGNKMTKVFVYIEQKAGWAGSSSRYQSFFMTNTDPDWNNEVVLIGNHLETTDSSLPNNGIKNILFSSIESQGPRTQEMTQRIFMAFPKEQYKIKIVGNKEENRDRLIKLLKKMVMFSNYYKQGFPHALFDSLGNPMNMAAKVKAKFTNNNYTPQQVITNLVEDYKSNHPNDINTEGWKHFIQIVPMLGDYILSDYNIAGGLNNQHKVISPFYLKFKNTFGKVSSWQDDDLYANDENSKPHYDIERTNNVINEQKLYDIGKKEYYDNLTPSAWIKPDLEVDIRSEFFEFVKENNEISVKPKDNLINNPTTIKVDGEIRSFPIIKGELAESDIDTRPREMNLSDDFLNYLLFILYPDTMDKRDDEGNVIEKVPYNWAKVLANLIGSGQNGYLTKQNLLSNIPSELLNEQDVKFSLKPEDASSQHSGAFPLEIDFNGVFGDKHFSLDFKFTKQLDEPDPNIGIWGTEKYDKPEDLDHILINNTEEDVKRNSEMLLPILNMEQSTSYWVVPKGASEYIDEGLYEWNKHTQMFILKVEGGSLQYSLTTTLEYMAGIHANVFQATFDIDIKPYEITHIVFNDIDLFNEKDDRVCRTQLLI